jgi:hypothetical protein
MINLNPAAPKIHKADQLIGPVVNWRNALTCKLATFVGDTLNQHTVLPNAHSVANTPQLVMDRKLIEINSNSRLASFDISSMYTNIPTGCLTSIIEKSLMTNTNETYRTQQIQEIQSTVWRPNKITFPMMIISGNKKKA